MITKRSCSAAIVRCAPLPLVLVALGLCGCGGRSAPGDPFPQAYYRTGFPARDVSSQLDRALEAIKRLQVTATYETYRFERADSVTVADIRSSATLARASERYSSEQVKLGTGTIVRVRGREVAMLTNDHVVRVPDTVVIHHREARAGGGRSAGRTVESVSILRQTRYLVVGLPEHRPLRVLARDRAHDLALTAIELLQDPDPTIGALELPTGDPRRLGWGAFVYVAGYPGGFRMVTRGIVSDPNRGPDAAFLLDGLFNRGISGGLILAVRGDTDALELVGLATSAAAQPEYVLLPEVRELDEEGLLVPYQGSLYLERVSRLQYGITFSVPTTAVVRFLQGAGIVLRAAN